MAYKSTRVWVVGRRCRSESSYDGQGSTQVFEGIRLTASARFAEQGAEQGMRVVGFARTADTAIQLTL